MTDEYISRKKTLALLKSLGSRDYRSEKGTIQDAIKMISSAEYTPAADVAPVVHGKWVSEAKGGVYGPVCSVCGYYIPGIRFWNAPYCPKCGARMDGGEDRAVG